MPLSQQICDADGPDNVLVLMLRAEVLFWQQKYAEAVEVIQKVESLAGMSIETTINKVNPCRNCGGRKNPDGTDSGSVLGSGQFASSVHESSSAHQFRKAGVGSQRLRCHAANITV